MNRRTFLCGLSLGTLAIPLPVGAQPAVRVWRIGYLAPDSLSSSPHYIEAFRQGLRGLGYVEGQNVAIEDRWAEGKFDRLPDLASELVRLNMDVIVAGAAPATRAAKRATSQIPIVMVGVGPDPVEAGIVASLARPGGNITGLTTMLAESSAKRLELLREAAPKVTRVAVLWNSANPAKARDSRETQVAARALGLTVRSVEVQGPEQFERAHAAMTTERPGALLVLTDPLTFLYRKRIVEFAAATRIPAMYDLREYVGAGGLMSYGVDQIDLFRRAATYVDKILRGAKPADLPVEQPTKFELVINLKTAKALGLAIPQSLLIRADEIIQ